MRDERLYFSDILSACDDILEFASSKTLEAFLTEKITQSAVLGKLIIIGEAASHVSLETRRRFPEIPWNKIIGFRNTAVHAYFSLDWKIVWVTVVDEIPSLSAVIQKALQSMSS